jgi:L-asparagine oxygenase
MKPIYVFDDEERTALHAVLASVPGDPYQDYPGFTRAVADLAESGEVPAFFVDLCERVRKDRENGQSEAHALRNCPMDDEIPYLDHEDPTADKYAKKKTFVSEALLALFGRLVQTPLLAYGTRFGGDFFTDVIAINRFSGMQTGFSDGELVYHNERTAHRVRADFITLLGMRCPPNEYVYTSFVDGRDLLKHLTDREQEILREQYYVTPFDVFSKANNASLTDSDRHQILENHHSFRYLDTHTRTAPGAPVEAKDAIWALRNAITWSDKTRHRLLEGDLFTFANQDGMHSRDKMEINDPAKARDRWLLKTYAFRDQAAADRHAHRWLDGIPGRVGDD